MSLFTSCDVHEWPDEAPVVPLYVELEHVTAWDTLHVPFSRAGRPITDYNIRYSIRAYPLDELGNYSRVPVREFVFTRDMGEELDNRFFLEIPAGSYRLTAWTDYVTKDTLDHFYDTSGFYEIMLQGQHQGNTHLRDAFRGAKDIVLETGVMELVADTFRLGMKRPMGSYEFVCTDLQDFIDKEVRELKQNSRVDVDESDIHLEDYTVVFYYAGFMPNTFNALTDKAIDSSTGVQFRSKLSPINKEEASMGFDYVFVNSDESSVIMNIGLFNKDGKQLAMVSNVNVPLKRDQHTILRGKFLMADSDGGVSINPEFDGEHNIIIP
jgi:hypothetical protein